MTVSDTTAPLASFQRPFAPALAAALLLAALSACPSSKLVGDGAEYFVYAVAMARGEAPPLSSGALNAAKAILVAHEPRFDGWDVESATWAAKSGGRDFVHFWFYPILAAPGARVAMAVGASPAWSFVCLNVVLLALAWHMAFRRFGWIAAALVCGSPILWWADKVHTEVFTFSLLTIAVTVVATAPWWAMLAIGVASTQNPPLAVLLVPFAAGAWFARARRPDWRFFAGLTAGAAFAALHPIYYLVAHGKLSLLAEASRGVIPSVQELGAVLWDTNIGLFPGHPGLFVAVATAGVVLVFARPRAWLDPELAIGAVSVAAILLAAAQTSNIQHGGTPGISRYALWLMPFTARLIQLAAGGHAGSRALGSLAAASAMLCLVAYHPGVAEGAYRPSPLSRFVWTQHPGWFNPVPEVFSESISRGDGEIVVPAALPGCEKLLIQGGTSQRAMWPLPCYPGAVIPGECRSAGALCYANRDSTAYAFQPVPRPRGIHMRYDQAAAWGLDAEPVVRHIYEDIGWASMTPGDALGADRAVRQVSGIDRFWHFQSPRAVLLAARGIGAGARVYLRLPRPMTGSLIDATTGAAVAALSYPDGPGRLVDLRLPVGHTALLVVLR